MNSHISSKSLQCWIASAYDMASKKLELVPAPGETHLSQLLVIGKCIFSPQIDSMKDLSNEMELKYGLLTDPVDDLEQFTEALLFCAVQQKDFAVGVRQLGEEMLAFVENLVEIYATAITESNNSKISSPTNRSASFRRTMTNQNREIEQSLEPTSTTNIHQCACDTYLTTIAQLRMQNELLKEEITAKNKSLDSLENQLQRNLSQIQDFDKKIVKLESHIFQSDNENRKLVHQLMDMQGKRDRAESTVAALNDQLYSLSTKPDVSRESMISAALYDSSVLENTQQRLEIGRLMEYNKTLEEAVLKLEHEVSSNSSRHATIVKGLREEAGALQVIIEEKNEENTLLQSLNEKLRDALEQSRFQQSMLKRESFLLERQLMQSSFRSNDDDDDYGGDELVQTDSNMVDVDGVPLLSAPSGESTKSLGSKKSKVVLTIQTDMEIDTLRNQVQLLSDKLAGYESREGNEVQILSASLNELKLKLLASEAENKSLQTMCDQMKMEQDLTTASNQDSLLELRNAFAVMQSTNNRLVGENESLRSDLAISMASRNVDIEKSCWIW